MRAAFLGLIFVLASTGAVLAEGDKCCLTNTAFTGVCEETPAPGETCQSILDYLNTPNSAGKAYCGGSSVRGGWKLTSCKAAPQGQSTDAAEPETTSATAARR